MKKMLETLIKKELNISFCESCTGGYLASLLTDSDNSSKVINESYVTYSDDSKTKILRVDSKLIQEKSSISFEVCEAMVKGLKEITKADICIATTGVAGNEAVIFKDLVLEAGLVYIGFNVLDQFLVIEKNFKSPNKFIFKQKVADFIEDKVLQMLSRKS
ncbi:MAG: nicotinamide-nucleotide amidohydrolase family protein [Erysipelotrichales bacterium]|nr:nicotinamide-nucleotide amidohydrolase family protein [Erysipelotrichales bacterium]